MPDTERKLPGIFKMLSRIGLDLSSTEPAVNSTFVFQDKPFWRRSLSRSEVIAWMLPIAPLSWLVYSAFKIDTDIRGIPRQTPVPTPTATPRPTVQPVFSPSPIPKSAEAPQPAVAVTSTSNWPFRERLLNNRP